MTQSNHPDRPRKAVRFPNEKTDFELATGWLAHLEAGRVASKRTTTSAQLRRHVRSEIALLGRIA